MPHYTEYQYEDAAILAERLGLWRLAEANWRLAIRASERTKLNKDQKEKPQ